MVALKGAALSGGTAYVGGLTGTGAAIGAGGGCRAPAGTDGDGREMVACCNDLDPASDARGNGGGGPVGNGFANAGGFGGESSGMGIFIGMGGGLTGDFMAKFRSTSAGNSGTI